MRGGLLSATDTLPNAPLSRGLCSWVLTWRRCRPCLVQRAGLIEGPWPTSTSSSLHRASLWGNGSVPCPSAWRSLSPRTFFPLTHLSLAFLLEEPVTGTAFSGGQGTLSRRPTVSASAVTVRQPPKKVSLLTGKPGRGQAVGDFVSLLVHSCAVRCGCLIYPGRDGSGSSSCG